MFTTIPDCKSSFLKRSGNLVLALICTHGLILSQADIQYDPWDWVTYKNSSYISSISEGNEYVYFASNGGVLRYHFFGKFWDDPITTSQGLADDFIYAIYYDMNTHILWVSSRAGLNYSMDRGQRWELVDNSTLGLRPSERIVQIGSTPDYLWCFTTSQILKLDHLSGYMITPYATLPDQEITWGSSLLENNSKNLAILNDFTASDGWINSLDGLLGPDLEEVPISTIYMDRFSDIWIGTWGGPAFHGDFQMKQLIPIPYGPAQTSTMMLLKAKNGIWFGGESGVAKQTGITYYEMDRNIWELHRFGYEIRFGDDQALCGVDVDNEIWFGTTSGILILDNKTKSWYHLSEMKGLPDKRVSSIAYDGMYVYVGTLIGIARYSPQSKRSRPWILAESLRGEKIYALNWDGQDLWISTQVGLFRWSSKDETLDVYGSFGEEIDPFENLSTDTKAGIISPIMAIVSSDSMVYFGDEFGILTYDKYHHKWDRITGESRLIGFRIYSLEVSDSPIGKGKIIWIGTNKGVLMFELLVSNQNMKLGFFRQLTTNSGLPSSRVYAIVVDDDFAWFGTPEGLVRFDWVKYAQ